MDYNDLFDLFDLFDLMDSPFDGSLSDILNTFAFLSVIYIVLIVAFLGALYVLSSFKWQSIGRKAGLQKDWMPFVPFARTIYKLSIVDEPWWRMFFKDGFLLYAWLLNWIITAINSSWMTFSVVLIVLYGLCYIAYNIFFRYKYYTAHNIRPYLALVILVPPIFVVLQATDYLIAFSRVFPFTGEGTSRAILDAVDVPQMKDSRGNPVAVTNAMRPSDKGAPWESGKAASPSSKSGAPSVTGMSGMYAGQTIPLAPNDEMVIGRDNVSCNLIVDKNAEKVSRKHCGITYNPAQGAYMVTDYSSNGTFIDDGNRLVANMQTALQRGTIIALGNRENRFKLD